MWKTSKWMLTLILLAGLVIPTIGFAEANKSTPEYDIMQYANEMQPGWNLGNTFDGFDTGKVVLDETAWGNPRVTKELITEIKDQGFNSIRIPITFDTRLGQAPEYTINPEFLSRFDQVVNWALDADLKVMINIHHDSWSWVADGMPSDHENTVTKFNAIWTQLAEHYKDYSTDLMFESLNEPQFWGSGGDVESQKFLNELNDSFYQIVRGSEGLNDIRPLVIPTLHTNFEEQKHVDNLYNWISQTNDPYIISTVHYYSFWPFSVNLDGYSTFEETSMKHISENFDRVYNKFVKNDIPVVIGEFGLLGFDENTGTIQQGEKLKFFEYMINYAEEKGLIHMLWDNGQHFNRSTLVWNDPHLYNMMAASWEGRSSTADTDFVFLKKGEEITDVKRVLNLNGNEFVSLKLGEKNLVEGEDYVLEGNHLTLKASLLSQLISTELGEMSVLTATFNTGADWTFTVYHYDSPVLSDSQGTISDFTIPLQYNGNLLKTMEATYADDGSPAGPQNWTAFKQFGYVFAPNYEDNLLTFPYGNDRFFKEINDQRGVELTFHFWSGVTVKYTVTKDGEQVVGKTIKSTLPEDDESENPEENDDNENESGTPGENDDNDPEAPEESNNDESETPKEDNPGKDEDKTNAGDENKETNEEENHVAPVNNNNKTNSENILGKAGEKLPETATGNYNLFITGIIILLVGGCIAFFVRKQKVQI
ncbi:cellulase family glycosylhydrolase [Metabacillus halosaccharovorans]|uniref:Cellulase family glycosylhydrolase n=1 Tax=Metabacillus halosaccharovorans TaxID=930124 RepID=A0ABT3DLW8_9BACI|nr:cellulase family glycosylhydrolase [Metabacillus halosaccharovorans]MCV9888058.1 cellulase family glycosylhydrolase [Metabacillus halosaccharovorans]